MSAIKWIFFDIGYTIVNEDGIWEDKVSQTLRKNPASQVTREEFFDALREAASHYVNNWPYAIKKLGFTTVIDYDPSFEQLFPDTIASLQKLHKQYHLGIIANQIPDLETRLKGFGIRDYFEVIVGSGDYGFHKPDPRIFQLALSLAKAKPEECLMVGDRLENDIVPAQKLGMKTAWIRQGFAKFQPLMIGKESPDYVIDSLSELADIPF